MRIIHCLSGRLNTSWLPLSERPSLVTSSLASTVPSAGHQLTGASATYARRWPSTAARCSASLSMSHGRPSGDGLRPEENSSISSPTGRARPASGSNHELKICRKIHWVQR